MQPLEMDRPTWPAVRIGGILAVIAVAMLAAACAHMAIDALGDVLLEHDSYDDLAHDTRSVAGAIALAALLLAGARGMYEAVRCALGRAAARRVAVDLPLPAVISAVVVLAIPILIAMEAVDAILAGTPTLDLSALLGGSIALGLITTAATAALAAIGATTLLRWCCSTQALLVRIIVACCVTRPARCSAGIARRADGHVGAVPATVHGRHAAKRGPPLLVS